MITTDPNHPDIVRGPPDETPVSQSKVYLALSESERKKGLIRPFRDAYRHVGLKAKNPLRDLTEEEHKRYNQFGYIKYEEYPKDQRDDSSVVGCFWTQKDLTNVGCGTITTMNRAIAETYARDPHFYGATYCLKCQMHRPVQEFTWYEMDGSEGPVIGT